MTDAESDKFMAGLIFGILMTLLVIFLNRRAYRRQVNPFNPSWHGPGDKHETGRKIARKLTGRMLWRDNDPSKN